MSARSRRFRGSRGAGSVFLAGLCGCTGQVDRFFPDASEAPALNSVGDADAPSEHADTDLQGGRTVVLTGERLNGDALTVRFGQRAATVLSYDLDPSGQTLSVVTPPGPVSGGPVPVTVAHTGGISVLEAGYEYQVPDGEAFAGEAGSLELLGYPDGTYRGALAFWPMEQRRRAGSLLAPGALYYLPYAVGETVAWSPSIGLPPWGSEGTLPVAGQVSLAPDSDGGVAPFIFSPDTGTGQFGICDTVEGTSPAWIPGIDYTLTVSGGVLAEPVTAQLAGVPPLVEDGEALEGLKLEDGVALINSANDLTLGFLPAGVIDADATYVLLELVVFSPESSLPDHPYEVARLNLRGDDGAGEATFPVSELQGMPEVDTRCAILGRELEAARQAGSAGAGDLEDDYLAAGCIDSSDPMGAYPLEAVLRASRHVIHRVALPEGAAGCATSGGCAGASALVVDLVDVYEVPASLLSLPVSQCQDEIDNDGDGLSDANDPGCSDGADDDEKDQSGLLVCDDGIDNDSDGTLDYQTGSLGDPGCQSPSDSSEQGTGVCDDGKDNDGDGLLDYREGSDTADPGCVSARDDGEHDDALVCDNGKDDDEDGFADYQLQARIGDPGCSSVADTSEVDTTGQWPCDDDLDTDNDGAIDQDDPGCLTDPGNGSSFTPWEGDEINPQLQCDDGKDNDGDGFVDYKVGGSTPGDPQCTNALSDDHENY